MSASLLSADATGANLQLWWDEVPQGWGESVGRGEGEKGGGVKQSSGDNPRACYQQGRVMGRARRCLRHLEPEPRGPLSAAAGVSECRHPLQ